MQCIAAFKIGPNSRLRGETGSLQGRWAALLLVAGVINCYPHLGKTLWVKIAVPLDWRGMLILLSCGLSGSATVFPQPGCTPKALSQEAKQALSRRGRMGCPSSATGWVQVPQRGLGGVGVKTPRGRSFCFSISGLLPGLFK